MPDRPDKPGKDHHAILDSVSETVERARKLRRLLEKTRERSMAITKSIPEREPKTLEDRMAKTLPKARKTLERLEQRRAQHRRSFDQITEENRLAKKQVEESRLLLRKHRGEEDDEDA